MAVDIKQLRIGSHVDFNGRRVKIKAIVEDSVAFDYTQDEKQLYLSPNAYDEFLSPISITPELLKELGFEDCSKKRWHTEDWEKRWGEHQYLSFTELHSGWRVHYFDGAKDRGQTVVRYLHEAEAFLVLHGVELIND